MCYKLGNDSFQEISFKLLLAYFSYIFTVVCLLRTISEKEIKGSTLLIFCPEDIKNELEELRVEE